jgi:hypothetical protein
MARDFFCLLFMCCFFAGLLFDFLLVVVEPGCAVFFVGQAVSGWFFVARLKKQLS